MSPVRMPEPLPDRLGEAGSVALLELVEVAGRAGRDEMLTLAAERFGRVVADEIGKVRLEMSQIRLEMSELRSDLRTEIAGTRVDLLRWSFLFWIGQVAALAGLLSLVVRGLR